MHDVDGMTHCGARWSGDDIQSKDALSLSAHRSVTMLALLGVPEDAI